jgi:hypothetical protein
MRVFAFRRWRQERRVRTLADPVDVSRHQLAPKSRAVIERGAVAATRVSEKAA